MADRDLNERQKSILEFIRDQLQTRGYPPSVREICKAVGLKSTSSVHAHLETLEKKGYIHRDPAKSRTIELTDDVFGISRREVVNIPVVGTVTAGEPILAVENITGYYPVPADMLPNSELFMLKVRGDSMVNAGILSGDNVIIQKQPTAHNGEIVCALIEDSATIKTFYKEDGHYRLQPQNDAYEPIITSHCDILGKVIGLIRTDM